MLEACFKVLLVNVTSISGVDCFALPSLNESQRSALDSVHVRHSRVSRLGLSPITHRHAKELSSDYFVLPIALTCKGLSLSLSDMCSRRTLS